MQDILYWESEGIKMDKEAIKQELVDKSNNILEKYSEPDTVESVSVMNMAAKTIS